MVPGYCWKQKLRIKMPPINLPPTSRGTPRINLVGSIFGDLKIVGFSHFTEDARHRIMWWLCKCSCGRQLTTSLPWIRYRQKRKKTVSCGHEEWEWPNCHLDESDFAYLAGLVDSEGTISLAYLGDKCAHYHGYAATLAIGMTCHTPSYLHKWVRLGHLSSRKAPSVKHRDVNTWSLSHKEIRKLLPRLQPYLILKQEQAALVTEFLSLGHGPSKMSLRSTQEYGPSAKRIYDRLAILNQRGVLHSYCGFVPSYPNQETKWAYLAGLVDGDGCLCLSMSQQRGCRHYRLGLTITGCHEGIPAIRSLFGDLGCLSLRKAQREKCAPGWSWQIATQELREILPFMVGRFITKREQAVIAAKFLDIYGCRNHRQTWDRAEGLHAEMRKLNRRGSEKIIASP